MMPSSPPHVIVDARPMLSQQTTGIGRYTSEIVRAMDVLATGRQFSYSLLVPHRQVDQARTLSLPNCTSIVPLPTLTKNLAHQIVKRRLRLSLDFLLPKGHYYFPAFTALPMYSRRSATVVHDLAHLDVPECVESGNNRLLGYSLPRAIRQSGKIIAVSEYTKQRIIHHFGLDPAVVQVIPPAVDRQVYRYIEPGLAQQTRERYGVSCTKYLLAVGTLEPRKNLVNLIDAFVELPPDVRRNLSLVLIGANGWDNGAVQGRIERARERKIDIVRPTSFVRDGDMAAFYSGARALAFIPHYEGFGIPPLEAYACSTPVLASRVASVPESAGGVAHYVDDPTDIAAIQRGLMSVLSLSERERMALLPAMQRHLDKFAWLHSAALTVNALTGITVAQAGVSPIDSLP